MLCRDLLLMSNFAIYHSPGMPHWNQSALETSWFGNEVLEELFEDACCH